MLPSHFFPEGVSYFFTEEKNGLDALSDAEREASASFGSKRLADFCTGRYCLRQCTSQFGYSGDILIGKKGMPVLPENITASLSHSKKLSGAIAGAREKYLSLGIDIEGDGRVHEGMWHLLFSSNETEFLKGLEKPQRDLVSTVFFSLKEAFYKLQYPLTDTFLDFHDVETTVVQDRYYIRTLKNVGTYFSPDRLIEGNMMEMDGAVITLCALPA